MTIHYAGDENPEPGDLLEQCFAVTKTDSRSCRVRGFDVVELAPIPGIVAPDFMAARPIYRLMGYITQ